MASLTELLAYKQEAARKQAAHVANVQQQRQAMQDPVNAMAGAYVAPQSTTYQAPAFQASAPEPPIHSTLNPFAIQPQPKQPTTLREKLMTKAQEPDPGLKVGPVENFTENMTDLGQSFLSGVGMLGDTVGWAAGQADRAFGGDGENAVKEWAYSMADNAEGLVDYQNLGRTETKGDFQKYIAPIGQQLPQLGLAAATGAASPLLATVQWALGEGAGEAGRFEREAVAKGVDPDIAAYNSSLVNLGNAVVSGPMAALTAPVGGAASKLPGVAGQVAGSAARAVDESVEEAYQPGVSKAADKPYPVGMADYAVGVLDNLFNKDTGTFGKDWMNEGTKTLLPTFLAGLAGGGGGGQVNSQQGQQVATEQPQNEPTTEPQVNNDFMAGRENLAPTSIGEVIQQKQAAPANSTYQNAPVGNIFRRNANKPPVQDRAGLLSQAEAELARLTENPQFNEEGYAAEDVSDEDLQRYADINSAVQRKDYATLTDMLEQRSGIQEMVVGDQGIAQAWQQLPQDFKNRYQAAKQMVQDGVPSRQIQDQTGFWIGADDKLRYEISDAQANIDIPLKGLNQRPLSRVYDNPDFYAFYPEARNKPVKMTEDDRVAGSYHQDGNLELSRPVAREADKEFNDATVLHETTHGVQLREGFAPGANAAYMEKVPVSGVGNRWVDAARELISNWDTQVQEDAAIQADRGGKYKVPKDPKNVAEARKVVKQFEDRYNAMSGYDRYMMLQGEIEARQVGDRRNLTREQIKERPIRPNPNAIVLNRHMYSNPETFRENEQVVKDVQNNKDNPSMGSMFGDSLRSAIQEMTLYNGSPTHWEGELNSDYRGSGEGGAVHGDGHYLSTDDVVSTQYATTYGGYDYTQAGKEVPAGSLEEQALSAAFEHRRQKLFNQSKKADRPRTVDDVINVDMNAVLNDYAANGFDTTLREVAAKLAKKGKISVKPRGQLATFDLPDDTVTIEESKPMSQQSAAVQEGLRKFVGDTNQSTGLATITLDGKPLADATSDDINQVFLDLLNPAFANGNNKAQAQAYLADEFNKAQEAQKRARKAHSAQGTDETLKAMREANTMVGRIANAIEIVKDRVEETYAEDSKTEYGFTYKGQNIYTLDDVPDVDPRITTALNYLVEQTSKGAKVSDVVDAAYQKTKDRSLPSHERAYWNNIVDVGSDTTHLERDVEDEFTPAEAPIGFSYRGMEISSEAAIKKYEDDFGDTKTADAFRMILTDLQDGANLDELLDAYQSVTRADPVLNRAIDILNQAQELEAEVEGDPIATWAQSKQAKRIVKGMLDTDSRDHDMWQALEQAASRAIGDRKGPRAASRVYLNAGIKARSYMGDLRWSKTGTVAKNYVVFDDNTTKRTGTVFQEVNGNGQRSNKNRPKVQPVSTAKGKTTDTAQSKSDRDAIIATVEAARKAVDQDTPFTPEELKTPEQNKVFDTVYNKFKAAGVKDANAQFSANIVSNVFDYISNVTGASAENLFRGELGLKDVKRGEGLKGDTSFGKDATEAIAGLFGGDPNETGNKLKIWLDNALETPVTLVHEVSHYVDDLIRQAARATGNQQLKDDWQAILAQGGVTRSQTDANFFDDLGGDGAEKAANSLLEYLKTGEAPAKLKALYERVKTWIKNAYSLISDQYKAELTPAMKDFWDRVLQFDAAAEQEYGIDAEAIAPFVENQLETIAKEVAAEDNKKVEVRGEYTLTSTTKGNITTTTKRKDMSKVTGFFETMLRSPSVMAQKYTQFKAYFDAGTFARREQDRMRVNWAHSIDKILGGRNMIGLRKGGIVTNDTEREQLQNAMTVGDLMGKELTAEELREMGANDNVVKAYKSMRILYTKIADALDRQRVKNKLPPLERIAGYVPHFFDSYRVAEIGEDGSVNILDSFKTMKEAERYAKSLDPSRQLSIRPVVNDFSGQAKLDAITVGDMQYFKVINKIADVFALSKEDAREFGSGVVKMANKGRFLGNAMQRKGFDGYNKDMEYQIRHMANLSARYVAMDELKRNARRLFEKQYGKWGNEYKGIAAYTKHYVESILGNPALDEDMWNKVIQGTGVAKWLPEHYQDRPALAASGALKSASAVARLGLFSVSSAFMNYTSLVHVNAITDTLTTARAIKEYLRPSLTTRKIYKAVGIDSDITEDSISQYSKNSTMQVMRSGLSMASSGLFQAADKTARKIAAIAGYRHGMAQGMHQEEAYLYARDIVNKTNFDYSVADAPAAFRTITGDILLQFRKYGIKATELGMNHLNGFQKVKYWGGILALAGIPGVIPGFDFIAALVKFLFPEQDLKLAIKEGIDALPVPREMKLPLAYGAFANLGFDLSNRAGLSSILPSSWQDVPGPALGYIGQVFKGIASVSTGGDFIEEFKKLATGPANMMSAVTGKVKNASGKTVFEAETLGERLHLFTGFRSIRRSTEADAIAIANANKARESAARTDAIKAYLADKSPENRKALRDVGATIQQVKAQAKWGTGTNHEQAVQSAIRGKDRDTYDTLTGYMQ